MFTKKTQNKRNRTPPSSPVSQQVNYMLPVCASAHTSSLSKCPIKEAAGAHIGRGCTAGMNQYDRIIAEKETILFKMIAVENVCEVILD